MLEERDRGRPNPLHKHKDPGVSDKDECGEIEVLTLKSAGRETIPNDCVGNTINNDFSDTL
jgi:hypothetical protein